MPIAVLRSLTGIMSYAIRRARRSPGRRASAPRAAGFVAAAGEPLEARQLFALAITPVPAGASATTLGAALLVPSTGVTITGGTYVGAASQAGSYTGFDLTSLTNQRLNIQNGLLLTTGLANNVLGPNDSGSTTAALATPGDPNLDALVGDDTFDANSLTLNFTTDAATRSILFDFIFGSEEFSEFVGSPFNDAFAAYLDGVQVSFDTSARPITINNNFFRVDNRGAAFDIEFDGLTPRIRTQAPLNPAVTNHTLKFVVADTSDTAYDTGAFVARLQGSPQVVAAPLTSLPNPGTIVLSASEFTVDETAPTASILVNRVGGTSGQVTVDYAITGATATNLLDFTGSTGTLVFADGQATQTLTFPILDDALAEGDETVTVTLSNAVDAGLGTPNVGTLTILDNERAVQIVPQLVTVSETASLVTLTVSRSGPLTGTVSVDYTTFDGASPLTPGFPAGVVDPAVANADYLPRSGTLVLADGQRSLTITIPIIGDFLDAENTEAFSVALSNPVGSAGPTGLGAQATAVVVIQNVDRPPSVYDITAFAPSGRIEALYLQVQDPLRPERVLDASNYDLFQHTERSFNSHSARQRVAISTVQYNAEVKTITIRPKSVLKSNVFYEVVLRSTTENGIISTSGEPLDGNFDRVAGDGISTADDFIGYFGRGTRLQFFDHDGDRVRLGATGGGVIEVFRDITRDARQVRYVGAMPATSAVFGRLTPARRNSDRSTTINTLLLNGARSFLSPPVLTTYLLP